ncbi:SIR2 family NAD-dependent protein deacylase [Bacillus sp. 275]|uniref:SIR2 family NAD-dependent protein deacylase n=1 Tax=Bacillus sp. 275 TaxID=1941347 RepID=UPI001E638C37|nr:SIR2 family protein [Bacillus sp. 275]
MSLDNLINNVHLNLSMSEEEAVALLTKISNTFKNNFFRKNQLKNIQDDVEILFSTLKSSGYIDEYIQCDCGEETEIYPLKTTHCDYCNQLLKNTFVHEITDLFKLKNELSQELNLRNEEILKSVIDDHFLGIFYELKDTIDTIIPFLGAGTSLPLGLDNWPNLLRGMGGSLKQQDRDFFDKRINKGDYLGAIDVLKNNTLNLSTDEDIKKHIVRQIEAKYKSGLAENYHNIKDIINLEPAFFITTNYDSSLIDYKEGDTYPYTLDQIEDAHELLNKGKQIVLHLHGHIRSPRSMIITKEDYEKLYKDDRIKSYLNAIMGTKNLLFIGFSFDDEYFKDIYDNSFKNLGGQHFIIQNNLHPDEARDMIKAGLRPISIKVEGTSDFNDNYVKALKIVLKNLL